MLMQRRLECRAGSPLRGNDTLFLSFPLILVTEREPSGVRHTIATLPKTLDPRVRGDDAAVSNRCDPSGLALGHPRHLAVVWVAKVILVKPASRAASIT